MLANIAAPLEMDGFAVNHRFQNHHQHNNHAPFAPQPQPSQSLRKRKAEAAPENNERLSKRMSLLNLEQSGQKLYVPVENSTTTTTTPTKHHHHHHHKTPADDSLMQVDDTKHKVYIYNLDDELSSSDTESESPENNKLVFLPDIEKHLAKTRILPHALLDPRTQVPSPSELAGKELVLYRVPHSLSVAPEQDSVRKAILEARERMRQRERERERERERVKEEVAEGRGVVGLGDVLMDAEVNGGGVMPGEDSDAMELD